MDAAIWGFIGVVVGGLITGLVSIRLETIRADKEAAFDSAKRSDDRQLGRDAFTRDTLLNLQDAFGVLLGQLVEYRTRLGGSPPAPDLRIAIPSRVVSVVSPALSRRGRGHSRFDSGLHRAMRGRDRHREHVHSR